MKKVLVLPAVVLLAVFISSAGVSHAGAEETGKYQRTVERYAVPDVTLINQKGERVKLKSYLSADKTVVLDFIYGTCTTICPVLSAGYTNFQKKIGADGGKVALVSISIDPENDTPAVMRDYLKRYNAKPGWDFLTGSRKDIDRVMRAFNAYVPNKMAHYPITFMRAPKSDSWVRIYGLIGTSDMLAEYRKLVQHP
ncbi:MAG: SCO family protein [Thermodesulfovibrionales bacterium]